jgi:hypothetical protein
MGECFEESWATVFPNRPNQHRPVRDALEIESSFA